MCMAGIIHVTLHSGSTNYPFNVLLGMWFIDGFEQI